MKKTFIVKIEFIKSIEFGRYGNYLAAFFRKKIYNE